MAKMPKLPVADMMWRPNSDMITGNEAWILCGGTHQSIISYDLSAVIIRVFTEIINMGLIHGANTDIDTLLGQMRLGDVIWNR